MAATTINRAGITLTNDTGTPASPVGDGTLLSAADRVSVLNAIDALFTGANLTISGVFVAEGFGTHTLSAGGAGTQLLSVRNTTAGTANLGRIQVGNDSAADLLTLSAYSSTYTGASSFSIIDASGSPGIIVRASNAAGAIRFDTGGLTARLTISSAGVITPSSATILAGFFAYNSASDVGVANNTDIDFDTEVYDEGGHFAADTFTAPVTGRYLLSAHVRLTNSTGGAIVMQPVFLVSNHANGINIGYESVANAETVGFSGSVIVDMDASDTATVRYFGGGACTVEGNGIQRYSWFSGRLLL